MYQIVLNDAQKFSITAPVTQTTAAYKKTSIKAIKFTIADKSVSSAEIKAAFSDETATAEMNILFENGDHASTYTGYSVLSRIEEDMETGLFTVTMGETSDIPTLITNLQNALNKAVTDNDTKLKAVDTKIDNVAKDVTELKPAEINVSEMSLDEAKAYMIGASKLALSEFFASHYVTSDCHGGVSKEYSITAEKQQYLTQMISMVSLAKAAGKEFTPSWNARGEECTYDWTADELTALSFTIESYVRPRISKQQKYESQINDCTSSADVARIVFDYETVDTVVSA